jgi:hypothetical protein
MRDYGVRNCLESGVYTFRDKRPLGALIVIYAENGRKEFAANPDSIGSLNEGVERRLMPLDESEIRDLSGDARRKTWLNQLARGGNSGLADVARGYLKFLKSLT